MESLNLNAKVPQLRNVKAFCALFETFKNYGFTEWDDVVGLLEVQSGKQICSATHRLIKHREYLILTDLYNPSQNNELLVIKKNKKIIITPIGQLQFKTVTALGELSKNIIYVDKTKLNFPLTLRLWKTGDIFYPLGMKGKKKVSKYLKDEKLSLLEKENTWVLCSKEDIIWVVGMRADERYKVTHLTTHIFKIEMT